MTRFWCVLLALFMASSATAAPALYHQAIVNDNPSLYYLLDSSAGQAANIGSLGGAFNGTFNGTPIRGVPTPGNDKGVTFDSSDDWIESLGSAPAQFTGNPNMSIETIVRIPANATSTLWAPFLHWGDANPQTGRSATFGLQNNNADRLFAGFYDSGMRSVTTIPLGVWHHVVWVRNGAPNGSQSGSTLYLDGNAIPLTADTDLGGPLVPNVTSTPFRINRGHDFTRWFQGTMDELALFDYALTPQQVVDHYAASGLSSQAIAGLYNTGVDDNGQFLNDGVVDPHYKLVQSSDPAYPGPNTYATLIPNGFWANNQVSSRWIAPAANEDYPVGAPPHPAGPYTYRLSVDLTGLDPASVHVSGSWAADAGGQVYLNGQPTPNLCNNAFSLVNFNLTAGFGYGLNTIDFVVNNDAMAGANPTGLRVDNIAGAGSPSVIGVGSPQSGAIALAAPAPNPAFHSARLAYTLPLAGHVRLSIRSVAGRMVRRLVDRDAPVGPGVATWDGATDTGATAAPGVYFVVLESPAGIASRRLVWLR
jgi:hypothetical protein